MKTRSLKAVLNEFADHFGVTRPDYDIGVWWEQAVHELEQEDAELLHSSFPPGNHPYLIKMKQTLAHRLQLQESS